MYVFLNYISIGLCGYYTVFKSCLTFSFMYMLSILSIEVTIVNLFLCICIFRLLW